MIEFLKALQAAIGKKLLIVRDRLQAHRSRRVRRRVDAQRGALALQLLPAYAPGLNPAEYIRGYLQHHAMPNYCAAHPGDLVTVVQRNFPTSLFESVATDPAIKLQRPPALPG